MRFRASPERTCMRLPDNRLLISFVCFAVWWIITLMGAQFFDMISREYYSLGFAKFFLPYLSNIGFLSLVIYSWDWRDIGLRLPAEPKRWLLLWFPSLYIVGFAIYAIMYGPASPAELVRLALNLLPMAASEELMFRGVLYRALRSRLNLWPAVWLSALLFGFIHWANVLESGYFGVGLFQVINTLLFGVVLVSIAQRTGSLIPAIIYHWVWNFVTFAALGIDYLPAPPPDPFVPFRWSLIVIGVVGVFIFELPNLIYAVYLLRRTAKEESALTTQADLARHAARQHPWQIKHADW
ncbi:MAG: CPBP family intramembrane metalloprotease [Mesorhizobium sp.]|nr:MAG: CPBP family intramembrane metalloprotease [Mesorhizobium sp.]